MSYVALARKWRPREFSQMVGQEHVLRALSSALDSGRVHHAFLFTGTRGVGKTTIARIFAKSLNCEKGVSSHPCGVCSACREIDEGRFVDLLEVDAASRTKVDDTRELLDNVQYSPARGRYKVYLIDEVHMLSNHSFNALLKTLEEPPPHVKFLLATTDPQKLPVTVLSRCLQFNLKRLPTPSIRDRLAYIVKEENIPSEPAALELVARAAAGSLRDGLSLLDQLIAFGAGRISEVDAIAMLGTIDRAHIVRLMEKIADRDAPAVLKEVAHLDESAPDYLAALDELASLIQKIALRQAVPGYDAGELFSAEALDALAGKIGAEELQLYYQMALLGRRDLDLAPDPRGGFEMVLLRMLAFTAEETRQPSTTAAAGGAGAARQTNPQAASSPSASARATAAAAANGSSTASAGAVNGNGAARRAEPAPPPPADGPAPNFTPDAWPTIIASLNVQGLARQLAANCTLIGREGNAIRLVLDARGSHYRTAQAENLLRDSLSRVCGTPVALKIEIADTVSDTPARQQAKVLDERQQSARAALESDPTVKALQDKFGAAIVPDSIKPLN